MGKGEEISFLPEERGINLCHLGTPGVPDVLMSLRLWTFLMFLMPWTLLVSLMSLMFWCP